MAAVALATRKRALAFCGRVAAAAPAAVLRIAPAASTLLYVPAWAAGARSFAADACAAGSAPTREAQMRSVLEDKLQAEYVEIKDVSGGCGDFYALLVVAKQFEGIPMVKQHRLVNDALEAHIGKMHGLTLRTMAPSKFKELQATHAAGGGKA